MTNDMIKWWDNFNFNHYIKVLIIKKNKNKCYEAQSRRKKKWSIK